MTGEHIDVGAYALGLLESQDKAAFEAHLASCPSCHAELTEFAAMKSLLTGLGPVQSPEDAAPPVTDLLRRRAAASRRRTRWAVAVGAAACVAALGGGLAVGFTASPSPGQPVAGTAVLTGQLHSAINLRNGVSGTVGLLSKAWGTYVSLRLENVHGPLECELIAVAKTGERRVVTGWLVSSPGDGVPGHPAPLLVQGGTAIPVGSLARFDVIAVNGPTLLSIPV